MKNLFKRSLIKLSTDTNLIQGILVREAFVIRNLEDLHVVTLQLVYKRVPLWARLV